MLLRPVQFSNSIMPMLVTPSAMVALVSLGQLANIFPKLVTQPGIVTLTRPEQPWKASLPTLVTVLGTVTRVRPEHWKNVCDPMLATLAGKKKLVKPVH